ncbi:MAG: FadR/GntR family transcriptional regulator [Pseudomonadota bacterium]
MARKALNVKIEEAAAPPLREGSQTLPGRASSGAGVIAAQLHQAILEGIYGYGDRLPAERDLASHYNASRSTIREALKRLEDQNLLSRRIGSGTFVNYRAVPDRESIANVTSPIELIQVRMALEPKIARLAAINATGRDLALMATALERVEKAQHDRESFTAADEQFHLSLAECTHNPLMAWLYQQINNVRGHTQWNRMKDKILTPNRISEYNGQHRRLYEALCSHDADSAVRIVEEHLEKARRDLVGASAG